MRDKIFNKIISLVTVGCIFAIITIGGVFDIEWLYLTGCACLVLSAVFFISFGIIKGVPLFIDWLKHRR